MPHDLLLTLLDEAYSRPSWHGPNLRGSLRGATPDQAAWRPTSKSHNIWELAVHAAYWKYVVRRRLTGEKRGSFPVPGSNFFLRPVELTDAAWKDDLDILDSSHQDLRATVASLPDRVPEKMLHMIRGAASHDVYHAGQIRLLRRLMASKGGPK